MNPQYAANSPPCSASLSRANRARLKRCETTELVLEPALHVLLQRLETVSAAEQDTDPLAYAPWWPVCWLGLVTS